jgi:GAF domain-containing protein
MIDGPRAQLVDNIRIAIANANDEQAVLRAAVELIDAFSENFNWTGVYMLKEGKLHVGPYIGPTTDHTVIELNKGICGAAASQRKSVIVDDVLNDSRFLACSLTTRSEIVVPLMDGEEVLGEIDIDSDRPTNFTSDDRKMLEQVAAVVVDRLRAVR